MVDAGADNLIPMELALKIANKISEDERFSVYILVPLWPEGIPSSGSVQEILYWQVNLIYRFPSEVHLEVFEFRSNCIDVVR